MTMVRCESCETEYEDELRLLPGTTHGPVDCIAALVQARDELRAYITTEGPEHLRTENACLRSALARSENERKMAVDALSRTQKRCTELLEDVRVLKGEFEADVEAILQGSGVKS
jgi:hypothetical protein